MRVYLETIYTVVMHFLRKEMIQMPRRDSKGPPTGAKGPHDGRGSGKGKGRATGKGVGRRKGGEKGPCK